MTWEVAGTVTVEKSPAREEMDLSALLGELPFGTTGLFDGIVVEAPVKRDEGILVWRPSGRSVRSVRPPQDLYVRFANLALARDAEEIRSFAQRWGPIGRYDHGLPENRFRSIDDSASRRSWTTADGEVPCESVRLWRMWATSAAGLIAIIQGLREGKPTGSGPWKTMPSTDPEYPAEALHDYPEDRLDAEQRARMFREQEEEFEVWMNLWLDVAGTRPHFDWRSGLDLVGRGGLFPAIALQIASSTNRDVHVAYCAVCGSMVQRARKPQVDRLVYCDNEDCCNRGRKRLSAQRLAARRRASGGESR